MKNLYDRRWDDIFLYSISVGPEEMVIETQDNRGPSTICARIVRDIIDSFHWKSRYLMRLRSATYNLW